MNVIKNLICLVAFSLFISACSTNMLVDSSESIGDETISFVAFDGVPSNIAINYLRSLGWDMARVVNKTNLSIVFTYQCTQGLFPINTRCATQIDAINKASRLSYSWAQSDPDYSEHMYFYIGGKDFGSFNNSLTNLIEQLKRDKEKLVELGFPAPSDGEG
ncbi:hypothetical protein [Oceanobacter mangrovi]|uniref:hypothetical protein n=1 Tax=Oceanobacter mangrovi TaxID=2862510 RepID=UPI001C8E27E2|nr:hypothetical protein [Oceanobacter mangrovi]